MKAYELKFSGFTGEHAESCTKIYEYLLDNGKMNFHPLLLPDCWKRFGRYLWSVKSPLTLDQVLPSNVAWIEPENNDILYAFALWLMREDV